MILSKIAELMDTVFIILRKQKLIFLHWYHHLTVLIYAWYSFSTLASVCRWQSVINFMIHSIMYSYYCTRTMRIRLPKEIPRLITSLQIIQMVYGIFIALCAITYKSIGFECKTNYAVLFWAISMYCSYFVLFVNFFFQSYVESHEKTQ